MEQTLEIAKQQRKQAIILSFKAIVSWLYDCLFMYFLLPSIIWSSLLTLGNAAGMCHEEIGFYMQLMAGAIFAFTFKLVHVIFFTPMSLLETLCVGRRSCCRWLGDRILILLSFVFIEIPTATCFLIALQWTQEYFFLVCFILTGFLRLAALLIFPHLASAFVAGGDEFPKEFDGLKSKIISLANRVKYRGRRILTFDCNETDLHANASALSLQMNISRQLLATHKESENEILGIIANELGHWHKMHLFKNIPIDMLYMCLFSWYIVYFIRDEALLKDFGIQ